MPPVISTIVMLRLFARRQRASMSAYFTNSLTSPSGLGLLASPPATGLPGRAARGPVAPRKMACRPPVGNALAVQGYRLALGGQPGRCPVLIGGGHGRQDARPCSARRPVALLRSRRLDLRLFCFGFCLLCVRCSRRSRHSREVLELTWTNLTLKRASSASRPSGEWSDVDYDVLCEGAVVGRIFKSAAAPVGTPWMWMLAYGQHEDRTPIYGYEPTREAAMAAFAKSWRRE